MVEPLLTRGRLVATLSVVTVAAVLAGLVAAVLTGRLDVLSFVLVCGAVTVVAISTGVSR